MHEVLRQRFEEESSQVYQNLQSRVIECRTELSEVQNSRQAVRLCRKWSDVADGMDTASRATQSQNHRLMLGEMARQVRHLVRESSARC